MFNIGAGYEPALACWIRARVAWRAGNDVRDGMARRAESLARAADRGLGLHPVGSHGYVPPELTIRSDDDVAWDLEPLQTR